MTNGLRVEVTISVVPVSAFGLTVEAKRKALQASAEVSPGYLVGTLRSRDDIVSDGVRDCIGKLSETVRNAPEWWHEALQ